MQEKRRIHIVRFNGQELKAEHGQNLKHLLHLNKLSPHNGKSHWLNCTGFGTCGTCAVQIIGAQPEERTKVEDWRLNFYPHKNYEDFRLSCQVSIDRDMEVHKHDGFWGEQKSRDQE